ncbi:hypothetical protein [Nocardioides immobilis]|uniref:hypothetical protein n=1 Tax=Nocardioides immobilis TaxID=2049295 RepID=UPI001FE91351|nr:hypothetical protein [Nocardioides immobilis]
MGRKIGLTSSAVQQQLGVAQPDFGVLFDDMDTTSRAVPMSRLLQPKAEAEIAFVLGEDLSIASAHVALEIVDSRISACDISFGDPLRPGQVVLSGALGPMTAVGAGDVVETTISGVTLTARFPEDA